MNFKYIFNLTIIFRKLGIKKSNLEIKVTLYCIANNFFWKMTVFQIYKFVLLNDVMLHMQK